MKFVPDQGLVEAARRGNPDALEQLLQQCQPDMAQFARKVCATPEDVEDAVQEALWIMSRKIGTLRMASAFAAWMFRVVRHECYRLFRSNQHEQPLSPALYVDNHEIDPFGLQAALKRDVVSAIASLQPAYQSVLIMRDIQEMTAPEVADELGLTVEAVKSRLHRARKIVRESLRHWMEN
jgi:RNA polymerase sigma factor (sigma-70 family)